MRILAMDTATSACSVALWIDGAVTQHRFEEMARGQAEALAPMIRDVLDDAGIAANSLDLLAVTVGPGAFTGLRIGLATARGMALATDLPCLGLTTCEVIAHAIDKSLWQGGTLLVTLDSKRSDIYVQTFCGLDETHSEPQAMDPANLEKWLHGTPGPVHIVGDARETALNALQGTTIEAVGINTADFPDAAVLAELASKRWSNEQPTTLPAPLYLRPPDAKLPKNGGRLRP